MQLNTCFCLKIAPYGIFSEQTTWYPYLGMGKEGGNPEKGVPSTYPCKTEEKRQINTMVFILLGFQNPPRENNANLASL
jgi:hypothetical protein